MYAVEPVLIQSPRAMSRYETGRCRSAFIVMALVQALRSHLNPGAKPPRLNGSNLIAGGWMHWLRICLTRHCRIAGRRTSCPTGICSSQRPGNTVKYSITGPADTLIADQDQMNNPERDLIRQG